MNGQLEVSACGYVLNQRFTDATYIEIIRAAHEHLKRHRATPPIYVLLTYIIDYHDEEHEVVVDLTSKVFEYDRLTTRETPPVSIKGGL